MEERDQPREFEEGTDPTFEMPVTNDEDTQPFVVPPELAPLESGMPEVPPPEMMGEPPQPDPVEEEFDDDFDDDFDDEEEEEEEEEEEVIPLTPEEAYEKLQLDMAELSQILDQQSQKLMAKNRRAILSSALFMILVAIYMVWAGAQLKVAFRPEAVADAATGVARDAIPQAAEGLELMLEDGAADIAESFGASVVDSLPGYRKVLIQDIEPAMESLSELISERIFKEILETPTEAYASAKEGPARTRALDAMLADLDQRLAVTLGNQDAETRIAQALLLTKQTNRALRKRAEGRQEGHDHELLLMWLSVIAER